MSKTNKLVTPSNLQFNHLTVFEYTNTASSIRLYYHLWKKINVNVELFDYFRITNLIISSNMNIPNDVHFDIKFTKILCQNLW